MEADGYPVVRSGGLVEIGGGCAPGGQECQTDGFYEPAAGASLCELMAELISSVGSVEGVGDCSVFRSHSKDGVMWFVEQRPEREQVRLSAVTSR